ncbi:MAG: hypothetical protein WAN28_05745, partial [Terracidiphilus sp.]
MCKSRAKSADKGHKDIFFNSSFFLYAAFALLVLIHSKPIRRREFRNKRLKPYEGPIRSGNPPGLQQSRNRDHTSVVCLRPVLSLHAFRIIAKSIIFHRRNSADFR